MIGKKQALTAAKKRYVPHLMFVIMTGVAWIWLASLVLKNRTVPLFTHHDDSEVPEPVGASRDGVCLGACLEGVDLCRIQPRERQPSCTKEGNVGEKADCSALCGAGVVWVDVLRDQAGEYNQHGQALADCPC